MDLWRLIIQAFLQVGQLCLSVAGGQNTVIADLLEPGRQAVLKKTPDKLHRIQRHALLAPLLPVILVRKCDFTVSHRLDAPIAQGNAMCISPQVVDYLSRSAKWLLGIHHPLDRKSVV